MAHSSSHVSFQDAEIEVCNVLEGVDSNDTSSEAYDIAALEEKLSQLLRDYPLIPRWGKIAIEYESDVNNASILINKITEALSSIDSEALRLTTFFSSVTVEISPIGIRRELESLGIQIDKLKSELNAITDKKARKEEYILMHEQTLAKMERTFFTRLTHGKGAINFEKANIQRENSEIETLQTRIGEIEEQVRDLEKQIEQRNNVAREFLAKVAPILELLRNIHCPIGGPAYVPFSDDEKGEATLKDLLEKLKITMEGILSSNAPLTDEQFDLVDEYRMLKTQIKEGKSE